jgi:hypothetical protein
MRSVATKGGRVMAAAGASAAAPPLHPAGVEALRIAGQLALVEDELAGAGAVVAPGGADKAALAEAGEKVGDAIDVVLRIVRRYLVSRRASESNCGLADAMKDGAE